MKACEPFGGGWLKRLGAAAACGLAGLASPSLCAATTYHNLVVNQPIPDNDTVGVLSSRAGHSG